MRRLSLSADRSLLQGLDCELCNPVIISVSALIAENKRIVSTGVAIVVDNCIMSFVKLISHSSNNSNA